MKTVAAGFNQENLRLKLYSTTRGTCPGAAARGGDVLPPQAGRVPGPGLPVRAGPRGQVRGGDGEVCRVEPRGVPCPRSCIAPWAPITICPLCILAAPRYTAEVIQCLQTWGL